MTLRIEKAFDVSMGTLLRIQTSFAIAKKRRNEGQINLSRRAGPAG
jgi:plasmid maintenance system antidote protein VapI